MKLDPDRLYYVYHESRDRQPVFLSPADYLFFLEGIRKNVIAYCDILAYCIMPHYFHLLIHTNYQGATNLKRRGGTVNRIENAFHLILRNFNTYKKVPQNQKETLFVQKETLFSLVNNGDPDYPQMCINHIHQSPLKEDCVRKIEHWPFTSFHEYIEEEPPLFCDKKAGLKYFYLSDLSVYDHAYRIIPKEELYLTLGLSDTKHTVSPRYRIRKELLRKMVNDNRRLLTPSMYEQRNNALLTSLEKWLHEKKYGSIHLFLPILKNNEPNVRPLISKLWAQGVVTYASSTDFVKKTMKHFEIDAKTQFAMNRYGIPEPTNVAPTSLDKVEAILVPLLLADRSGNRVGYGGGYYDRLLKETKAVKIGLSLSNPVDHISQKNLWDVPLNFLITPQKIYNYG